MSNINRLGRHVDKSGYVWILAPDHPKSHKRWVQEHVAVAEKAMGRAIPKGAVVHHVNQNPSDNRTCNLVVLQSPGRHMRVHAMMERLQDTGSLALKRCTKCKKIKPVGEFHRAVRPNLDGRYPYCRACEKASHTDYYRRHRLEIQAESKRAYDALNPDEKEARRAKWRAGYARRRRNGTPEYLARQKEQARARRQKRKMEAMGI